MDTPSKATEGESPIVQNEAPEQPHGRVQPLLIQPAVRDRTALWVLSSAVVGFLLPVCSCALLLGASIAGLGFIGSSGQSSPGFGDAVAIVKVEGVISTGDASDFGAGALSGVVIDDLLRAEADPSVKAIIIRVDSPGGTVTGSAQIHEVIQEIEKPVIVSMGAVAASGGYYVSAPADYIFARADTVTGSLGVIMTIFNAKELVDEIGVDVITLTSGPNKNLGSSWEEMTPEHREILEGFIGESYEEFVSVVADGRGLDRDAVLGLADGRIFSGRQAVDNGLVDELGNRADAIQKAADMGGISGEPRIVEYEHVPGLDQFLMGLASRLNKTEADRVLELIGEFTTPSLEYRYLGPGSQ